MTHRGSKRNGNDRLPKRQRFKVKSYCSDGQSDSSERKATSGYVHRQKCFSDERSGRSSGFSNKNDNLQAQPIGMPTLPRASYGQKNLSALHIISSPKHDQGLKPPSESYSMSRFTESSYNTPSTTPTCLSPATSSVTCYCNNKSDEEQSKFQRDKRDHQVSISW